MGSEFRLERARERSGPHRAVGLLCERRFDQEPGHDEYVVAFAHSPAELLCREHCRTLFVSGYGRLGRRPMIPCL